MTCFLTVTMKLDWLYGSHIEVLLLRFPINLKRLKVCVLKPFPTPALPHLWIEPCKVGVDTLVCNTYFFSFFFFFLDCFIWARLVVGLNGWHLNQKLKQFVRSSSCILSISVKKEENKQTNWNKYELNRSKDQEKIKESGQIMEINLQRWHKNLKSIIPDMIQDETRRVSHYSKGLYQAAINQALPSSKHSRYQSNGEHTFRLVHVEDKNVPLFFFKKENNQWCITEQKTHTHKHT